MTVFRANTILSLLTLKRVCHEIVNLYFVNDSNPSGALIKDENTFDFSFDFAEIFDFFKKIRGVKDTARSKAKAAMGMTLRSQKDIISSRDKV